MVMTSKSGSDQFHGSASDYFTYQGMWAGTEFVHNYAPFHANNLSGTIGGPVSRSQHAYFFFAIEPLRASSATGNGVVTYEDPQFVNWAKQTSPTLWARNSSASSRRRTPRQPESRKTAGNRSHRLAGPSLPQTYLATCR